MISAAQDGRVYLQGFSGFISQKEEVAHPPSVFYISCLNVPNLSNVMFNGSGEILPPVVQDMVRVE